MPNDGGPAFPNPGIDDSHTATEAIARSGMSLRDYFAGMALQSLSTIHVNRSIGSVSWDELAERAYNLADAMIKQRSLPTERGE